jgi:hypothetical protein
VNTYLICPFHPGGPASYRSGTEGWGIGELRLTMTLGDHLKFGHTRTGQNWTMGDRPGLSSTTHTACSSCGKRILLRQLRCCAPAGVNLDSMREFGSNLQSASHSVTSRSVFWIAGPRPTAGPRVLSAASGSSSAHLSHLGSPHRYGSLGPPADTAGWRNAEGGRAWHSAPRHVPIACPSPVPDDSKSPASWPLVTSLPFEMQPLNPRSLRNS